MILWTALPVARKCDRSDRRWGGRDWGAGHAKPHDEGLDIAKSVFQVHGVDVAGDVIIHRQFKRRYLIALFKKLPPLPRGYGSLRNAHHWSRELQALGHLVRLMPPAWPTATARCRRQSNCLAQRPLRVDS
jgi:transposase